MSSGSPAESSEEGDAVVLQHSVGFHEAFHFYTYFLFLKDLHIYISQ